MSTLPNLTPTLTTPLHSDYEERPRILLLYGSTRQRSFSRLLVEEAARLLQHFGAETGSSIHQACLCRTMRRVITPRFRNCCN
jgi:hypothetical protein